MKKTVTALAALVVITAGAIFIFGQTADKKFEGKQKIGHRGQFGKRGGDKIMGRLFRQLDITEEQKDQIKTIRAGAKEDGMALRSEMRQTRKQLAGLGTDGVFDQFEVETLAAKQAELTKKMIIGREKVKAQIFAVLTPEQKAKANELKTRFSQKMKERMEKRKIRFGEKTNQ